MVKSSMEYVFDTAPGKRYVFPTHVNDLVIDRSDAEASEVFVVTVESGKETHAHAHESLEQIYCILEGEGILFIGPERKEHPFRRSQVVKVPPATLHWVRATSGTRLRYLCIDCFCPNGKLDEKTWDDHVRTVCREHGYSYADVASFRTDVGKSGS